MPTDVLYGKTLRKSFARTPEIMDMPNLLEIQKSSYQWFLNTGLKEVFQDVDAVTGATYSSEGLISNVRSGIIYYLQSK